MNRITIDVTQPLPSGTQPIFNDDDELEVRSLFEGKSKSYPAIQRCQEMDIYVPTCDNRLIEYDFDKIVVNVDTEYQNVKICHSPQYGNMLLLDDDPNLAESDLAYTRAITGNGRQNFADKTVLILGGGDGGILNELLKQSPKFVTMVEIDQVVIDAAIKHLRGICEDSMDSLEGPNYKVIVEDCVPILKKYVQEGRTFDYVINDLTAIPVSTTPQGSRWDFLRLILQLSMDVLSETGRYFTQGNGANNVHALKLYEEQLQKLTRKVDFSKETICVPSYHELYPDYEITKVY